MSSLDNVLKKYVSKYAMPDLARKDIYNALSLYSDLRPSLEMFVFNDGSSRDLVKLQGTIPITYKVFNDGSSRNLVKLQGTIPITYKGIVYNIPVELWIMDVHPQNAPMVFVRPTTSMQIRSGGYVNANGKVDVPYLRDWAHDFSTIDMKLEEDGSDVVTNETTTSQAQTPAVAPVGSVNHNYLPYPPSFPVTGVLQPEQYHFPYNSQQPLNNYNFQQLPTTSCTPPPFQSHPLSQPAGAGGYGQGLPYPPGTPNMGPPLSLSNSVIGTDPLAPGQAGGTVKEEHLRASLLSAVEHKIRQKLLEVFAQAQAEMNVLRKTESDLTRGKENLVEMLSGLEFEKVRLEADITALQSSDLEVKGMLLKMEESETLDVDKAVVTTAPLYRQLLDTFAEEQAIEDAIYYLGEGLRKNKIELEVFLKQVRELSRRQFMQRALIQSSREKAGLPLLM